MIKTRRILQSGMPILLGLSLAGVGLLSGCANVDDSKRGKIGPDYNDAASYRFKRNAAMSRIPY